MLVVALDAAVVREDGVLPAHGSSVVTGTDLGEHDALSVVVLLLADHLETRRVQPVLRSVDVRHLAQTHRGETGGPVGLLADLELFGSEKEVGWLGPDTLAVVLDDVGDEAFLEDAGLLGVIVHKGNEVIDLLGGQLDVDLDAASGIVLHDPAGLILGDALLQQTLGL